MCQNIVSVNSGWANGVILPFTCVEFDRYVLHTDESVRALLRSLVDSAADRAANLMTKTAFDAVQMECGWNHEENNVLLDGTLAIGGVSTLHLDWFHLYLQTGIWNYEMAFAFLFLGRARTVPKITWSAAQDFASRLTWPRKYPRQPRC